MKGEVMIRQAMSVGLLFLYHLRAASRSKAVLTSSEGGHLYSGLIKQN